MATRDKGPGKISYLFGPFQFTPARQLLLRDGEPVRIGARALDILTRLLRQPGEPVSKQELQEFAWPGSYVHDSNLRVNIAALRRALSDSAENASYIASVPWRGYRFVGAVEIVSDSAGRPITPVVITRRSLPEQTAVIGRSAQISQLVNALAKERCTTIVGPGGVGKTTVAISVAHQVRERYGDVICFVDLATIDDPQYAGAAIANAVGARQTSDDHLSGVINALLGQHALLILDNCEHLLAAVAAAVSRLLAALPDITILATSREPLGNVLEYVHRLPMLEVPRVSQSLTAHDAMEYSAVELFVTRARERGNYTLTDVDAPLVAAICQQLDGIPLAIELAASKTAAFGVPTLLSMLEQRFRLLSNGPRDAPLRQQTLLATLDWSYRLLSEDEAKLLRLLSVFVGVFYLADAIALSEATGLSASQTISALERLTARSLISTEYNGGVLRCRLLETTKVYAAERLADEAERERAMLVYARHILATFERADSEWAKGDKYAWLSEYAPRIDDLRKVLSWAFGADGDKKLGITLTAMAIPLWEELSLVGEFRSAVIRALRELEDTDDCPTNIKMKLAWSRASGMNFAQPFTADTDAAWLACFELGIEDNNTEFQLRGLWGLSVTLIYTGRSLEAIDRLNKFKEVAEACSDWSAIPEADRLLGMAEIYLGQLNSASQRLEKLALRYERDQVPVRNTRYNLDQLVAIKCSLALVVWLSGEPNRALQVVREATERAESIGHTISLSNLLSLGSIPVALWAGDIEAAARYQSMLEEDGRREDIEIWGRMRRFFGAVLRAKRNEPGAIVEAEAKLQDLIDWGFTMRAPMYYCMIAEMHLANGDIEGAGSAMHGARKYAWLPGERWCLPEVLRIDGLLQSHTNALAAERLMSDAIRTAREIGAYALEARAALPLSDILIGEHRVEEAFGVVDAAYAKIAEKGGYPALVEARNRLRILRTAGVKSPTMPGRVTS